MKFISFRNGCQCSERIMIPLQNDIIHATIKAGVRKIQPIPAPIRNSNDDECEAAGLDLPDKELIEQCLSGDNKAFDCLVHRYQRQIYVYCCRMLGNTDEALDAAQDCFIKAYYALQSFRSDSPLLPWLFRIAHNTCVDIARSKSRRSSTSLDEIEEERGSLPAPEPGPEHLAIQSESARSLREAVLRLPERYRAAITLFHFNGLSIREISKALDRPEGTIKSDLHHAREMLRNNMEGAADGT